MRIASGGVQHERNTFAHTPTALQDFERDSRDRQVVGEAKRTGEPAVAQRKTPNHWQLSEWRDEMLALWLAGFHHIYCPSSGTFSPLSRFRRGLGQSSFETKPSTRARYLHAEGGLDHLF